MQLASREFLKDNRIVKYTIENETTAAAEEWAELVIQTGDEWDKTLPYCSIQDFRNVNILTPVLRGFAIKVNEHFKTLAFPATNIAILLKRTSLAYWVGRIFLETEIETEAFKRQVFYREDDAVDWLMSQIGD